MSEIDLLTKQVTQLVELYQSSAIAHGEAIAVGRHRVANREYDRITSLAHELRSRGSAGEDALLTLMQNQALGVRVWAASHCLPFASAMAEEVLEAAAAGPPSPIRLGAEMTLVEWKAGRL